MKKWFLENKLMIISSVVTAILFGYTSILQNCRQDALEKRVIEAENRAVHRTETAFALGISGLKQTAIILENSLIETRAQNVLLIECVKANNCKMFPDLTKVKEIPKYTPISETYFNIQQQMVENEKEGK